MLVVALLAVPATALAQCPRTSLGDVEDEVMCPVCGTPLGLATEAPQAIRQRAFIERLVADCRSKAEIKTALAAEFGDDVLALPPDDGFSAAAYVVPVLAMLGGLAAIGVAAARWRRRPRAAAGGERLGGGGERLDADGEGPAAGRERRAADNERLDADLERYDV